MSDNKSYEYRDIPEHEHSHSLFIRCLNCHTFGTPMPTPYVSAVECGNCSSIETVKYYPSCCIEADRDARLVEIDKLKSEQKYPTVWAYEQACRTIEKLRADLELTAEALSAFSKLVENGDLVRNTSRDSDGDFFISQGIKLINALDAAERILTKLNEDTK